MNDIQLIDYEHLLNQMPGICFIKDLNLNYSWANQAGLAAARFIHLEEVLGKSDHDMPWQIMADKFIKQDLLVLQGKSQFTIEENPPNQEGFTSLALLKKSPFYSRHNTVQGVLGVGFEVSQENCANIFSLFMSSNLNFKDFMITPNLQKKDFIYGDLKFSKRQAQILSYLFKGHSKASIAQYLNLSPRTIEFYLNMIKEKLGCKNKTDIINKAFELGFIDLMFWKTFG